MTAVKKKVAYRSADPDEIPGIDDLLHRLGLGGFVRDSIRSVMGRNSNWIGTTEAGRQVFVKQLHAGDREVRLDRTRHMAQVAGQRLRMPQLLGIDKDSALIALEYLPDADTGADLAADEEFTSELAVAAGGLVGALHSLPGDGFDPTAHPLPPVRALDGLSMDYFLQASSAEIEMWSLLQNDQPLVAALRSLKSSDEQQIQGRTPIHGDLRLDQFLIVDGALHLSDFEETRLGDPARDIGAFAGEWLYLAAASLPTALAGTLMVGAVATHAQIVATGVSEIERRRPLVEAFLTGYLDARPQARADETLLSRSARFAGWHMLDRMLAGAANTARLSAVSKAAAGIGRALLLTPYEFAPTLGLVA